MTFRKSLFCSSITPLALGLGIGVATLGSIPSAHANPCAAKACAQNPCCAKSPCGANPCAAKNPCAANPCAANPCAANPCAANPCAANPCAANPCAANPCAANPCAANPCAANPCAANPCAANPCAANPCAANPCAANPCAANPCAANPCAANPCAANPCAANPCAANPCAANPCAAASPAELSDAQAISEWDRLVNAMRTTYAKSGEPHTGQFFDWINVTKSPYQSSTHGDRYMVNIVNEKGKGYLKWEDAGVLPEGAVVAKPTIVGKANGTAKVGPLFIMEKMAKGWNKDSLDWKYTMILANGKTWGVTGGQNSNGMKFCADCHNAMGEDTDGLLFLPEEYRR